jgi:hypothetical protein
MFSTLEPEPEAKSTICFMCAAGLAEEELFWG